ncbi:MAG: hypothetical protein JZU63_12195, partial [Rhodoferax sp.]|nr:hypothetical protein [Rhodoferax sp.]
ASVLVACGFGASLVWFLIARGIEKVLSSTAKHLAIGSDQIVSTSSQMSASSQTLAERAKEQAAALEQTSSSLEEISSMAKRNAE